MTLGSVVSRAVDRAIVSVGVPAWVGRPAPGGVSQAEAVTPADAVDVGKVSTGLLGDLVAERAAP